MKREFSLVIMLVFGFILLIGQPLSAQTDDESLIQMAILLDTSSSMDGLIAQAKSQLWKIVNELALSKKNNISPKLEVALFEYGNDRIAEKDGYIRQVAPLTADLDQISDELFKLTTYGGSEYCGEVIKLASDRLKWSKSNKILKIIFIAGNEPFTQGNTDYKKACKEAIAKGIIVNTIFCGNFEEGINTKWKEGADLADGTYMNIDQNQQVAVVKTPMDDEIIDLGRQLNETYLAYGSSGKEKKVMQERQDTNAASMSKESLVQRNVTKSSQQYSNANWDLVDAVKNKDVKLEELKPQDLPEEMKKMSEKERVAYLDNTAKKRNELQEKINKLNKERNDYIAKESQKKSDENTLDKAMIKAIRDQAVRKNYKFSN